MKYIGFDYHKQYSFATEIDGETGDMRFARLDNTDEAIGNFINGGEDTCAVMESCRTWPVLYEILKDKVAGVKLAHPYRVKAIASARIKTDKIDSRILAELLAADLIPESHIRAEDNRNNQMILRQRAFLVSTRTRIKNRIHFIVDRQQLNIRSTVKGLTDLFGKAGMNWLRLCEEFSVIDRQLLDQLLSLIDLLNSLIQESDSIISRIASEDENAQLLMTIPGVGKFLSVLISTEIDRIGRFPTGDKLASYIGLIPSTHSSGGLTYHGRITKQGNKWLRWAFTEAAQIAKRYNAQLG